MSSIEEMREKRFQFLHELYVLSGADEAKAFDYYAVGTRLGFDHRLTNLIWQYLVAERLIREAGLGGEICITHRGIVEIEEALTHRDKATEHFPALNIIQVGQMIDSQIQQASPAATQVLSREDTREELEELIESLKDCIDQLGLEHQRQTDLLAQIRTIDAQMSSSKPSRTIISESLGTARRILEEAAGGALAVGFIETIKGLLAG